MKEVSKAKQIVEFYKEISKIKKPRLTDIAKEFNVSLQYVSRCIEVEKKAINRNLYCEITKMYFEEKKNINTISGILNISQPTIRKMLRENDPEKFNREKELRKIESAERRKISKRRGSSANVEEEKIIMIGLEKQQEINALSMSTKRKLSDKAMYINNIQQYEVVQNNKTGNTYARLRKQFRDIAAADIPKRFALKEY